MEPSEFYQPELALVHDQGFGKYAAACAEVVRELVPDDIQHPLAVDLGSGSGILAKALVDEGFDVIGVDISEAMIELARKKTPGATFIQSSLWDYRLPKCDVVTSVGECFNYLFDEKSNDQNLRSLFERIHEALKPGGHFVFDILTPGILDSPYIHPRIVEGENWTLRIEPKVDPGRMTYARSLFLTTQFDGQFKTLHETHHQQLYAINTLKSWLKEIGFSFDMHRGYAGTKFRPGHVGFICVKS